VVGVDASRVACLAPEPGAPPLRRQ
jgi:hypothetical protein